MKHFPRITLAAIALCSALCPARAQTTDNAVIDRHIASAARAAKSDLLGPLALCKTATPELGPSFMDFYNAKVVNEESHLLDFWPEPGEYTLRLECAGKNTASSGFFCGIESLRLRGRRPRVTAMAHDKDKDWRKDPKLYGGD